MANTLREKHPSGSALSPQPASTGSQKPARIYVVALSPILNRIQFVPVDTATHSPVSQGEASCQVCWEPGESQPIADSTFSEHFHLLCEEKNKN